MTWFRMPSRAELLANVPLTTDFRLPAATLRGHSVAQQPANSPRAGNQPPPKWNPLYALTPRFVKVEAKFARALQRVDDKLLDALDALKVNWKDGAKPDSAAAKEGFDAMFKASDRLPEFNVGDANGINARLAFNVKVMPSEQLAQLIIGIAQYAEGASSGQIPVITGLGGPFVAGVRSQVGTELARRIARSDLPPTIGREIRRLAVASNPPDPRTIRDGLARIEEAVDHFFFFPNLSKDLSAQDPVAENYATLKNAVIREVLQYALDNGTTATQMAKALGCISPEKLLDIRSSAVDGLSRANLAIDQSLDDALAEGPDQSVS